MTAALAARRLAALAVAALLAACGTAPKAPASRGGGYYQDDGPPDRVPVDLAKVPDAEPRVEPLHRFANRPYTALGRSYVPMTADAPLRQRGHASWYGRQFHGARTSSGEIYDMFAMTAAHPTMPIPSFARVTSVRTGASVIVRVNDRGPFKHDRIIDLSYAAATRLGIVASGTGEVEVERITFADIAAGRCCSRAPASAGAAPSTAPASEPVRIADAPPATAPSPAVAAPVPPSAVAVPVPPAGATPLPTPGAASVPPTAPAEAPRAPATAADAASRWSIQLGAFGQLANAQALRDAVAEALAQRAPEVGAPRIEQDGPLFRVLLGALPDRAAAVLVAQRIERALGRDTTLVFR